MWQIIKFFSSNVYFWILIFSAFAFFALCRKKRWIIITGIVLYALFWIAGCRFFAQTLMKPLEFKFRPPNIDSLKASGIKEVMILGGGAYECDEPHLCSWHVKDSSTMRLAAGLEIAALLGDDARIICTGGGLGIPEAEYMKNLILVFQPQRIVFADNEARRTIDHAQSAIKYLQDKKFVLVSSAYHLPRAVKVFSGIGYHPIPFPVDYQFNDKTTFLQFFPSTEMLYKTHKAVNEYFAMIIYLISRS